MHALLFGSIDVSSSFLKANSASARSCDSNNTMEWELLEGFTSNFLSDMKMGQFEQQQSGYCMATLKI